MPLFRVSAYTPSGDLKTLRNEAASSGDLVRTLSAQGYIVVEVEQEKSKKLSGAKKTLKLENQHLFCSMLSAFLKSGLSLTEVLRLLQKQTKDKTLKPVLSEMRDSVESGYSLANAMRSMGVFRESLIGMVESGERSSSLTDILDKAASLIQSEINLRRKLQAALVYPIMMLCVGLGVVAFLLAYVVPKITQIVTESGGTLPLATRVLLFSSNVVRVGWLPALLIGFLAYRRFKKKGVTLNIPFFRDIKNNLTFSLIFSQISTLLRTGVPLVQALEMTAPIDNVKGRLPSVAEEVRHGYRFSQGLEREGSVPEEIIAVVRVGEMGGNLPDCLERVAGNSWEFAQSSMQKWSSLAEPMIILVLGLLVGFVVVAVLLPIFELSSLAV